MQRSRLVLLCLTVLAVAAWFATSNAPQNEKEGVRALPPSTPTKPTHAQRRTAHLEGAQQQSEKKSAQVEDMALLLPDPWEPWIAMEAKHDLNPKADPLWASHAIAKIDDYYQDLATAIATREDYKPFMPNVVFKDCRQQSCLVELEFPTFELSMAFLRMEEEQRFRLEFNVRSSIPCPLRETAIPRDPNVEQAPFSVLLHYECNG